MSNDCIAIMLPSSDVSYFAPRPFAARPANPASTAMHACSAPLWSPIATTDGNGGSSGSPFVLAKPLRACAT